MVKTYKQEKSNQNLTSFYKTFNVGITNHSSLTSKIRTSMKCILV